MVKHQPLQVYERQLCLSCITGIYGCRWKRYQRSHDDTTKWELLWSLILLLTFCLLLVWFYFWWEAHNDYNEFNCLIVPEVCESPVNDLVENNSKRTKTLLG
ncbi:glycerophosphodiester phosphodiesterase domain-containing protein 5-like protein, partial [Lates japonicus]